METTLKPNSLSETIDLIVTKYHAGLRHSLAEIPPLFEKVARVHGATNPNFLEAYKVFSDWSVSLLFHLYREEEILFPLLLSGKCDPKQVQSLNEFISILEADHEQDGVIMDQLSHLMGNYVEEANDCQSVKRLKRELKEMCGSLCEHITLEDEGVFYRLCD